MKVKELSEQEIIEGLKNYELLAERKKKTNRRNTIILIVGLTLVYLYLRFFNTYFEVTEVDGNNELDLRFSTAWVINCPADFGKNNQEELLIRLSGLEDSPYVRVLNIEEGITEIYSTEFTWIQKKNLHTVKLPSTIKLIGPEAFMDCKGLKELIWAETANNTVICDKAFQNTGIEILTLPEGVAEISLWAFSHNYNLTKVSLPKSLNSMKRGSFEHCLALEEVAWSESLTTVPPMTFRGCEKLTTITNTEAIREVQSNAFTGTQIIPEQFQKR